MNYAKFEAIDNILDVLRYRLLSPIGASKEDWDLLVRAICNIGLSAGEEGRRGIVAKLIKLKGRRCDLCEALILPGREMRLVYNPPEPRFANIAWHLDPKNLLLSCAECERKHAEKNKIDFSNFAEVFYGEN